MSKKKMKLKIIRRLKLLFKRKCEYYLCENKWNQVIYPLLNGREFALRVCNNCYKDYRKVMEETPITTTGTTDFTWYGDGDNTKTIKEVE